MKFIVKRIANIIRPYLQNDYSRARFIEGDTIASNNIHIKGGIEFDNTSFIKLGRDIYFGDQCQIKAITLFQSRIDNQKFTPLISIGDRVQVTGRLQIHAMREVIIENDVLIASNVFIADGLHGYEVPNIPYKDQPMFRIEPIRIGEGSWVGQNVVIMPGVLIGKQCIVGANSVVTKSIPPYCIVAGSPARVIKRWNFTIGKWVVN